MAETNGNLLALVQDLAARLAQIEAWPLYQQHRFEVAEAERRRQQAERLERQWRAAGDAAAAALASGFVEPHNGTRWTASGDVLVFTGDPRGNAWALQPVSATQRLRNRARYHRSRLGPLEKDFAALQAAL